MGHRDLPWTSLDNYWSLHSRLCQDQVISLLSLDPKPFQLKNPHQELRRNRDDPLSRHLLAYAEQLSGNGLAGKPHIPLLTKSCFFKDFPQCPHRLALVDEGFHR